MGLNGLFDHGGQKGLFFLVNGAEFKQALRDAFAFIDGPSCPT